MRRLGDNPGRFAFQPSLSAILFENKLNAFWLVAYYQQQQ